MNRHFARHSRSVILLADDDDDDAFIFGHVLSKVDPTHHLVHVKDGLEAMQYLKGEGCFCERDRFPEPHLMVLDLKMPQMNGFDVLEALRWDKKLCSLAVIVLSASDFQEDERRALELGARGYFTKPVGSDKLAQIITTICIQWLPHSLPDSFGLARKAA